MRKRFLLAASALSTLTFGCSKSDDKQPLPGNPKGVVYDDAGAKPQALDAASVQLPDATIIGPPGNPKGTFYDAGVVAPALDANLAPADGPRAPRDAGVIRRPPPDGPPLKGNPKGSFYDKGDKL